MRNFEAGVICFGFGFIVATFAILYGFSSGEVGAAGVGIAYYLIMYLIFRLVTRSSIREMHRGVKEYEAEQAEKRRLEKEKMEQWKKEHPEEYMAQQRHIEAQKEQYRRTAEILKNNM